MGSALDVVTADEPPVGSIDVDLIEYVVVTLPTREALDAVLPELAGLGDSPAVRIVDLVVVTLDDSGRPDLVDADSLPELRSLRERACCPGALLSRHDIELIALAIRPGCHAVILLVEDRWAHRLSAAARAVGGAIGAGERVGRARMEAALAQVTTSRAMT